MTTDWPSIDPTADLFGGDLFGDELLDMYNPSVAPINNILPDEAESGDQNGNRGNNAVDNDGLAVLQHSHSINDFTSILEDNNTVLPSPAKVVAIDHSHSIPRTSTESTPHIATTLATAVASVPAITSNTTGSGKKRPRDLSQNLLTGNSDASKKIATEASKSSPTLQRVVSNIGQQMVEASAANASLSVPVSSSVSAVSMSNLKDSQKKLEDKAAVAAVAQHVVTATVPLVHHTSLAPTVVKSASTVVPSTHPAAAAGKANHIVANASKVVPSAMQPSSDSSVCSTGGGAKTEESFKGVAQAAVTNLILSAGNNTNRNKEESDAFVKAVDTSTAHVAALTSNNWVAACAASISGAPPGSAQAAQAAALAAASDPAAAKAARARRATLTADERARQNRDRNREHARNTRLRKKAYVEELKRTLTELVSQRDAADVEKRHEKQRDLEVREVRYRVMEEFLKLRARGSEQNLLARWIAILEDGFTLTLPKTPYRSSAMIDSQPRRVLNGEAAQPLDTSKTVLQNANQCFDDASKVASFISSLFMGNAVQMTYHCERTHFMMDGVKAILDWTLKATLQTPNGNSAAKPSTFVVKGCMRATFSPASNKLASAELLFDTGTVVSQIKAMKSQQSLCPVEETGALLDSVLPPVPSNSVPITPNTTLPSSVSVVSTEKDASSDEEGIAIKSEPQTA
jgi:hypothetical protein